MVIINTIYDSKFDENIRRLSTYYNYLRSIKNFLIDEYGVWQDYATFYIRETQKVQGKKNADLNWIKRWLKIAWNTEFLINASPQQIDLIRINNQWLPIQSYYCIYAASEAFTYAIDLSKSESHAKARRKLTEYFDRTKIRPWNFTCTGNQSNISFNNFPRMDENNLPNNLQMNDVIPHEMIATCLRAEHKHRIDENFVKRKGKFKKYFNPGITSLFHFFYRLRVKSNYRDIDLFITAARDDIILEFADSLKEIVFWFLLISEIYLMRRFKKNNILQMMDDYFSKNSNHHLLKDRYEFYKRNI